MIEVVVNLDVGHFELISAAFTPGGYIYMNTFAGPEVPSVNDTIVGDPLLSVPLSISSVQSLTLNMGERPALCFEIHGDADQYFNLLSDNCVSVNAHYAPLNDYWNIINRIGIRAMDSRGECQNIAVNLDTCSAVLNGNPLSENYRRNDISIRRYSSHVRVSVPNCNSTTTLVMYIICQRNLSVWDPITDEMIRASMLKFVIARGININENAHGFLGKCYTISANSNTTEYDLSLLLITV